MEVSLSGGMILASVLDSCEPRPEILRGTFNPEVFTASLSPVLEYYRSGRRGIDEVYTDAEVFFAEATVPTQGLRTTLSEVFARLAGDVSVPAIHRLETAFGGGKTHTLIACVHIAMRGKELRNVTGDLVDERLLPLPGSVAVVGIAGDQIPVHRPQGDALVPYTLWGEIAYQVGGDDLYNEVLEEATSHAAPGDVYFRKVFGQRKALIMLDELAQYAARLEAARSDGASQLAAFLMSLHGYARTHPGVAVVLTLASASDAFAKQTEHLAALVSEVRGEETSESDALGIGEHAVRGVASVVARDAVQVTPVMANEISAVLAKRLFKSIDAEAAKQTADLYMDMYERNAESLPDVATNANSRDRMIAHYPFHPTLVDFLNFKLSEAENFQGTRGVLRVLSLAVRSLWQKQQAVPMIHACHLDMRSDRVVDEILGRTSSPDLLVALNADIGSVDTERLAEATSNAEMADARNPHPEGFSMYEYSWKTVFFHSLVGRADGITSNLFGLTESDALYATSFPGLTPPQVRIALEEIPRSAFYLRFADGKYFASDEPTINSVLARIRRTVRGKEIDDLVDQATGKILQGAAGGFSIENFISQPEHIPDGKGRPVLGVVSVGAETISVEEMLTTVGLNRPRLEQNVVLLLVPTTVTVKDDQAQGSLTIGAHTSRGEEAHERIRRIAREVRALRLLASDPQKYGISHRQLQDPEFQNMRSEREQALHTAVAGAYSRLFFASASGGIVEREIRTAGGEGGAPFIQTIREMLIAEGELLTPEHTTRSDVMNATKLFFADHDVISLQELRRRFLSYRDWPMLENASVLEPLIRAGASQGAWYVYRMGEQGSSRPEEIYGGETDVPMSANLMQGDYSIVSAAGAKQRGWLEEPGVSVEEIERDIVNALDVAGISTVQQVKEVVEGKYGELPQDLVESAVAGVVRRGRLITYQGSKEQDSKPELISGVEAIAHVPHADDVLVTRQEAEARGWMSTRRDQLVLSGHEGAAVLRGIIPRLGSIYNRGATTTIDSLDVGEIALPGGGMLSVHLQQVTPDDMKALAELFEVLGAVMSQGELQETFLSIEQPDDGCPFVAEVKKMRGERCSHEE